VRMAFVYAETPQNILAIWATIKIRVHTVKCLPSWIFQVKIFNTVHARDASHITMPNLMEICHTVAEILQFPAIFRVFFY